MVDRSGDIKKDLKHMISIEIDGFTLKQENKKSIIKGSLREHGRVLSHDT